jgi:hypothetical protein
MNVYTLIQCANPLHDFKVELDAQASVVFYPVNRLSNNNTSTAVTVKVGTTHVQIMTVSYYSITVNGRC